MSTRFRISAGILTAAVAVIALYAADVAGQNSTAKPPATGPAAPRIATTTTPAATTGKPYRTPRTADGQPDLQGFWTNATLTPLQRQQGVTAEFVTREEFEKRIAQRVAADEEQTKPGTTADVHYDFTQFALDKTQSKISLNYRTSQIVDPPDGRIPPLVPEAQKRLQEQQAEAKQRGGQYDRVQNMANATRCIIMGGAGPPLMDAGYNANYQIIQSKDSVMILTEMIHDARIIPLDSRPAPPAGYTGWMGSSRGRWDGETLVVETTNFNGRNPFQRSQTSPGSSDNLKVTERFTRIGPEQISYRFTVEDPTTWTRPWTAEQVLEAMEGPMFEVACHEGNYGVANTLAGARLEEKNRAEAAAQGAK